MLDKPMWRDQFAGLAGLPEKAAAMLDRHARFVALKQGTLIFGASGPPESLFLLLSGTVRVKLRGEDGREMAMYRVHAGENCALTTACLLAFEDYSAEAISETDVDAVMVPREVFEELMSVSSDFRAIVFEAYSKRVTDLFLALEDIAFKGMDIRVAQKLLELLDGKSVLHLTLQQLAVELSTARDLVSRQLSEFERRGWVHISEGEIGLRNAGTIRRLAQSP